MSTLERIRTGDVSLAVRRWGDPAHPPILLVHGYPDNSRVWDGVAGHLADRYHVVAYDVRGAGRSSVPRRTRDYRLEYLAADLAAVADAATADHRPVHLVGHDWGSIQAWDAVTEPRLADRFASFTSISGPCLDHIGQGLRDGRGKAGGLSQLRRSWYIGAFHLPFLAPLAWRTLLARRWPEMMQRWEGVRPPADDARASDGVHGIKLYRANVARRLLRPRERRTDLPVQLVVPTRDPFVGPDLTRGVERWAPDLRRVEIDAGHWLPLARPADTAGLIDGFIADLAARR